MHKITLIFLNPYIFAIQCQTFDIFNIWIWLIFKYYRFIPSGCNDIEIRKFGFVEKNIVFWFDCLNLNLFVSNKRQKEKVYIGKNIKKCYKKWCFAYATTIIINKITKLNIFKWNQTSQQYCFNCLWTSTTFFAVTNIQNNITVSIWTKHFEKL